MYVSTEKPHDWWMRLHHSVGKKNREWEIYRIGLRATSASLHFSCLFRVINLASIKIFSCRIAPSIIDPFLDRHFPEKSWWTGKGVSSYLLWPYVWKRELSKTLISNAFSQRTANYIWHKEVAITGNAREMKGQTFYTDHFETSR